MTLVAASFIAGTGDDLIVGLVDLGLAAWTFVPAAIVGRRGVGHAAFLLAIGILVTLGLTAAIMPFDPVLLVAPLLTALVALPYLDRRATRSVGALAWLETVAIVVRSEFLPPSAADTIVTGPMFQVTATAAVLSVGLYLVLQSTERVRTMLAQSAAAEAELRTAGDLVRGHHNLLQIVIEGTSDHVYLKDATGRYLLINEAVESWLGRSREAILGKTDADLFDPAVGAEVSRIDAEVLASGVPVTYEHSMVVGPRSRTYLTTKGVYRNDRGGVAGLFGISRDITERNQTEEQLRQAQKMEAVGRLAGGVAHDFNNVLTAISGYSELTMDALAPGDPIRNEVLEIQRGAERAATLTRQLLAFSRRQVLQPEVVDPNTVIGGLEAMLRRLIPESIDLRVVQHAEVGRVRVDRHQLEQVIVNLVLNARDAMPSGGRLTIETGNVDLDEDMVRDHGGIEPGPYVLVAVTDTGIGMSVETQSHVFEPFFTTKDAASGTGLGLATVHGTVSQSGGHVWVYSEPGRGSTFKIHLPRVDAPLAVAEPAPEARPISGQGTILVVEDEPSLRTLMHSVLTRAGYQTILAPNGEEGLALAREHIDRIDLVLSDVVMPVMSGPDLAAAIHRLRADLPVLLMSGYPDHSVDRDSEPEAEWLFIGKPFTPGLLLARIRDLLQMKAA